jgi:hypothetical protein
MTHKIEDHECFDKLVEVTGSDATFEKSLGIDMLPREATSQWVINLYTYTPSLAISTKKGYYIPNFCPMCGEDFRDE